jgi:protease-4
MDDSSPPPPAPAGPPPLPPPLRPPRKTNGWMILSIVLICVLLVFIAGSALRAFQGLLGGGPHRAAAPRLEEVTVEQNHSDHKILVMPIEGMIMSGGYGLQDQVRFIQEQFKQAERDDRVKAVLLKVNSPGGEVLASDNISAAIRKFQKESGKPVVASMGSLAASGGYYVAAPCRWIVAL